VRGVSPFQDHLPCPALRDWLVPTWEGKPAAAWICPPQRRWRAPRVLRRMLARASVEPVPDEPEPASLDVLVVLTPLPGPGTPLPEAAWSALRPGGTLVDLATIERRSVGQLLRPWMRTRRIREGAAMRVRQWLERGAYAPEQWVTVAPADVVVTMVKRAVP
jgi:hypothetical protein